MRVTCAGSRRPRRLVAVAGGVLTVAIATGGCGGRDAVLSAGQQDRLLAHVDEARAATGEEDRAGARSALGALERQVRRLAGDGVLDQPQAAALIAAVERAAARVDAELSPPPVDDPGRGPVTRESDQEPAGVPEGDGAEDEDDEKPGKRKGEDKEDRGKEDEGKGEKDDEEEDGD